jgi:hypothetical protein
MKKLAVLLVVLVSLISCADNKTIDGVTYRPYGLINESTTKNDSIEYEISLPAVCSGIVFVEMIVPSIYTFGFNLWEPVRKKGEKNDREKGIIK